MIQEVLALHAIFNVWFVVSVWVVNLCWTSIDLLGDSVQKVSCSVCIKLLAYVAWTVSLCCLFSCQLVDVSWPFQLNDLQSQPYFPSTFNLRRRDKARWYICISISKWIWNSISGDKRSRPQAQTQLEKLDAAVLWTYFLLNFKVRHKESIFWSSSIKFYERKQKVLQGQEN